MHLLMNKIYSLSLDSSQSTKGDGKVHRSDVTAIIKDWQLTAAFGNQKSLVNSQVLFWESSRGRLVEEEGKRPPRCTTTAKRRMGLQGGRGPVLCVLALSTGWHTQRAVGALSPAWAGEATDRSGLEPLPFSAFCKGCLSTTPLEVCWYSHVCQ